MCVNMCVLYNTTIYVKCQELGTFKVCVGVFVKWIYVSFGLCQQFSCDYHEQI